MDSFHHGLVGVDFLSLAEWQVEKKPSKDSKEACLAWLA